MDLAMVKQEQGETLRKYMRRFFDKRATVVDVTDKEVIDLFQDGLYHDCDTKAVEIASTNQVPNAMMEIYAASKKLAPSELDIPEKSDKANKPQPT
jgi:hypothetical protein